VWIDDASEVELNQPNQILVAVHNLDLKVERLASIQDQNSFDAVPDPVINISADPNLARIRIRIRSRFRRLKKKRLQVGRCRTNFSLK
jgi:hypothetical protein